MGNITEDSFTFEPQLKVILSPKTYQKLWQVFEEKIRPKGPKMHNKNNN
jgi:hypothetical protein